MSPTAFEDALFEAVRAHDKEAASQCGEPDPWTLEGGIADDEDATAERMNAMRVAIEAFTASFTKGHLTGTGDRVIKPTGYPFPGEVRAVFWTRAGEPRVVVEATGADYAGMLHIFNPSQVSKAP